MDNPVEKLEWDLYHGTKPCTSLKDLWAKYPFLQVVNGWDPYLQYVLHEKDVEPGDRAILDEGWSKRIAEAYNLANREKSKLNR